MVATHFAPCHIQSMTTRKKRPRDVSQRAKLVVEIATGQVEDQKPDEGKNPGGERLRRERKRKETKANCFGD
jgi:hypothetical protein